MGGVLWDDGVDLALTDAREHPDRPIGVVSAKADPLKAIEQVASRVFVFDVTQV